MPEQNKKRCVAVDFDGTLAEYDHFRGVDHLGDPVVEMVVKIKQALAEGHDVFIFTARVNPSDDSFQQGLDATKSYLLIADWCQKYIGTLLPITHEKLRSFTEMWDDRGRQVIQNTGLFVQELMGAIPQA